MNRHSSQSLIPSFHVVPGSVVREILSSLRKTVIDIVSQTYLAHERGETVNPDSYFLRFPDEPTNRIIALPAAITAHTEEQSVSGLKWIASYPSNIKVGIPRASAVLILNDTQTGYPYALLEAALISSVRTAASAVLGAFWLNRRKRRADHLAIVGGGVIARNILEMFAADRWFFKTISIHDIDPASAQTLASFAKKTGCAKACEEVSLKEALRGDIVVFASSAGAPYVTGDGTFQAGQIILNISLRDIGPEIIAESDNFFDDVEHCLKANTSPHLAEQRYGHRRFVTGTIASLIREDLLPSYTKPLIFSPFGMGILDIALGHVVYNRALEKENAIPIPSFFGEENRW